MRRRLQTVRVLLAVLLGLPTGGALAQRATILEAPVSEQRVSYVLHVALDAEHRLTGSGTVTWRNPDAVPVDSLQWHLYLNAFKQARSTFLRQRPSDAAELERRDAWGRVDITSLEDGSGNNLLHSLTYLRPQDGNLSDETVAAVALPEPVMPGETITLTIAFVAQLPHIVARTGYVVRADGQPFVMAAQWFPKLGVYEVPGQRYVPQDVPRGRWYTHQFHANSEFYADFGTYDVTIEVPADYVVGATGVRTEEHREAGTKTVRYLAEEVHDFAWTASPAYLEATETWRHVELRLLLQPEHRGQAQRHFDAARYALEAFDNLVGPYPYTTLTLVDGIGASNGMEYPTLITCGTWYNLPTWIRALELVLIHEFGHQYFYGMLASNEAEEAWLDEGINSYVEGKVMDASYGQGSLFDLPGAPISMTDVHRLVYAKVAPERGALFTPSYAHASNGDYGRISYSKAAVVMQSLEGLVGWPVMQDILRTYYERWRFRHPTTRDFWEVAEDVSGMDLEWFTDQYVYGTAVVDYALAELEVAEPAGGGFEASVRAERLRGGTFPVTVRVNFADGTRQDFAWDGEARERTFTTHHSSPATSAIIDPDFRVPLDINRLNNGQAVNASYRFATRFTGVLTVWLQFALRVMESLF